MNFDQISTVFIFFAYSYKNMVEWGLWGHYGVVKAISRFSHSNLFQDILTQRIHIRNTIRPKIKISP